MTFSNFEIYLLLNAPIVYFFHSKPPRQIPKTKTKIENKTTEKLSLILERKLTYTHREVFRHASIDASPTFNPISYFMPPIPTRRAYFFLSPSSFLRSQRIAARELTERKTQNRRKRGEEKPAKRSKP